MFAGGPKNYSYAIETNLMINRRMGRRTERRMDRHQPDVDVTARHGQCQKYHEVYVCVQWRG